MSWIISVALIGMSWIISVALMVMSLIMFVLLTAMLCWGLRYSLWRLSKGIVLDRSVPCPGSEDCALISAQPLALHRTRQLAETCSPTPQAALK
ncbi:unnamed protein product, partial [Staurois parvus]